MRRQRLMWVDRMLAILKGLINYVTTKFDHMSRRSFPITLHLCWRNCKLRRLLSSMCILTAIIFVMSRLPWPISDDAIGWNVLDRTPDSDEEIPIPLYDLPPLGMECKEHSLQTNNLVGNTSPSVTEKKNCPNCTASVLLFTSEQGGGLIARLLRHLLIPFQTIQLSNDTESVDAVIQQFVDILKPTEVRLFIFADYALMLQMSRLSREKINDYCRSSGIAIIGFLNEGENLNFDTRSVNYLPDMPIGLHRLSQDPWGLYLASDMPVLRILRQGRMHPGYLRKNPPLPELLRSDAEEYTNNSCCRTTFVFSPDHKYQYVPLVFTNIAKDGPIHEEQWTIANQNCVLDKTSATKEAIFQSLVIFDPGLIDGIRRVMFATHPDGLWINTALIMDAIVFLSDQTIHASTPAAWPFVAPGEQITQELSGQMHDPDLVRWILVDVDDVFTERPNDRMLADDVNSMIEAQSKWRKTVREFTFNLGFTGESFEQVRAENMGGYEALLAQRKSFWWFDHMWNHKVVTQMSEVELVNLMKLNEKFAREKDLWTENSVYSVTPSHSGTYPVYLPLYNAWMKMRNFTVTSTMQYAMPNGPHMGFKVYNVQVLPRQECWLYSTHQTMADVQGGQEALEQLVLGGHLFKQILLNPLNIFMTHLANYQFDRLALVLFDALFGFVSNWTTLHLVTASPSQLAVLYTQRLGGLGATELPVSVRNCDPLIDPDMWSAGWPCQSDRLPNFFIVGPHKTGTTALEFFLRLNPELQANRYQPAPRYEEMQFFDKPSFQGHHLNWYASQFPEGLNIIRFEKSAAYFSDPEVPARIAALLPKSKIIVFLMNPVERAYSWYQHIRSHRSLVTSLLSFTDLLNLADNVTREELSYLIPEAIFAQHRINITNSDIFEDVIRQIQEAKMWCVDPGLYAKHLTTWLTHFPAGQILLIQAEKFKQDPVQILEIVETFLKVRIPLNYSNYLEYNSTKKFFCLKDGIKFPEWDGGFKWPFSCLGPNKGRLYDPLDAEQTIPKFMRRYFFPSNMDLRQILRENPVLRHWLSKAGKEYPDWITVGT